ncbi:hypothetical protein H310_05651 [Aphanomyces invadans]|uniref:Apple domain-containing protein n=1 Tax=Aphanomyces invadans TaxID=157072 RepID=A0A024UAK4_9STRA|nr:hypothetical protein H310_05651 [Aphanomyces invadans]ETW03255.1 hypothetical protein H310_05651 [Aphanomyces invadans]|eukprot:XP_008868639.1 hypothetical protein H310_05651 [Aphanomyces invadans]
MVAVPSMLLASVGLTLVFAGPQSKVTNNIDYPGHDIGSTSQSDPSKCSVDCANNANCRVWVWTSYQGGTCWLKREQGNAAQLEGAVAGVLEGPQLPTNYGAMEDGTDYEGNDLGSTSRKFAEDCAEDCNKRDGTPKVQSTAFLARAPQRGETSVCSVR